MIPWLPEVDCSRKRRFHTSEGKGWQGLFWDLPHGLSPTSPVLKIRSRYEASRMCAGPVWLRLFVLRPSVVGYRAESESRFALVTHEKRERCIGTTQILCLSIFPHFGAKQVLFMIQSLKYSGSFFWSGIWDSVDCAKGPGSRKKRPAIEIWSHNTSYKTYLSNCSNWELG